MADDPPRFWGVDLLSFRGGETQEEIRREKREKGLIQSKFKSF